MAGAAQRFEDVIAWQKARIFAVAVYRAAGQGCFARDFGLRDQICRAAAYLMSNIAEGFERRQPKEYRRFLLITKSSLAEARAQLYLAADLDYIDRSTADRLFAQSDEPARIIAGLRSAIGRDQ
jgi:four helix bundle protein